MSRYSPQGYIVKLQMLKIKTVLVEGISDKKVVMRVMAAYEESGVSLVELIVDTAELISSSAEAVSNREKVEFLHTMAVAKGLPLAALVDREFREFNIEAREDLLQAHKVIEGNLFWTRGHSIENYFLTAGSALRFLRFQFPEEILGVLDEERTSTLVADVIKESSAISIAAYERSLLTRLGGIWSTSHWKIELGRVRLDDEEFQDAICSRGVERTVAVDFVRRIQELRLSIDAQEDEAVLRWISHGHLTIEALWAALGKLLEGEGIRSQIVEQVAYGYSDLKLRIAADFWAGQIIVHNTESPSGLWQWVVQAA